MNDTAEPLPCELVASARGLAVTWHGPLGPAVVRFDRMRSLAPERREHLGRSRAPDRNAPEVTLGRRDVASYVQPDGAWLAVGGGDADVLVAPGAWAVSHAPLPDAIVAAGFDGNGIVVRRVDPASGQPQGEPRRVVRRRSGAGRVRAVPTQAGTLVLYAPADEAMLGIVALVEGEARDVHHRLRAPCRWLHAASAGPHTAVAIGYAGERVDAAMLDARGAMRERPHTLLQMPGGRLGEPRAVWMGDGFVLTVAEQRTRALHVLALSGGRRAAVLGGVGAPYAAGHYGEQLVVAQVAATADRVELRLVTSDRFGGGGQARRLDITPSDTAERRRRMAASDLLERVRARLVSHGYRASAARVAMDPDGLGLRVVEPDGTSRWRVRPTGRSMRIEVVVRRADPGRAPPERPAVQRFVRWLRTGVAAGPRARRGAERRTFEQLVGGAGRLLRSERGADAIRIEVECTGVPPAEVLVGWTRRLRAHLAGG